jgi:large subunit ribosomal protein L28
MSFQCELSGVSALYGNKVSHSQRKTRRRFEPNIRIVRFISDLMGQVYRFKVAAKTLRSVEKVGGFDQYIIKTPDKSLSAKAKTVRKKLISKQMEVRNES